MPHARLINKLKALGITGEVLGLSKSFLTNRKQNVVVEGEMSSWTDVKSGIPQGSVLGTILFLVFISDMSNNVLSTCNMFADDAKVYREVNKPEDHVALQSDLDRLNEWSKRWKLPFNETKCKCMLVYLCTSVAVSPSYIGDE